jgi:hypothetical protein
MVRTVRAFVIATAIAFGFVNCGGGGGSSTPTTPTPTISGVIVTGPASTAKPGDSAQFTATASLSNGTTQTVTNQATWQSSNTSVATVSSSGLVTMTSVGEVDIRATYQSVTGSAHVTVSTPAPPTPSAFSVCGSVKEDTGSAPVAAATVAVKDTSLSTTSDSVGQYCVNGVGAGRITLRASKSGYDIAERDITVSGNMTADIPMHRQSSPTPTPSPSPPAPHPGPNGPACDASSIPANATCINNGTPPVTAVCDDGVFSCSQTRSGTCSTHGGVKCWVCPGLLCNGLTISQSGQNFTAAFGGFSSVNGGR